MTKYFSMRAAWNELKNCQGGLGKTLAVGKLVGKGVTNTVVYVVTEALPDICEQQEKKLKKALDSDNLRPEQREKIEAKVERYESYKEKHGETLERWKNERKNR